MARKWPLLLLLSMGLACLVAGCFEAAAPPKGENAKDGMKAPSPKPVAGRLVFRLAENLTLGYPATIGDLEFARLVEERSRGRIKIIVYYGAKLGDERSVIEQIQFGGIDFARVNSAPLAEFHRPMLILSLPYLFRDSEHLRKTLYGPVGDEILAGLSRINLVGLTYYTSAARSFYAKKPIHSVADMRGLKIRVQQSKLYMDFIRLLGAEPVPMAFGDVYNAMLMGEVDGAENNWASYFEVNHYRIAKYYLMDTHTRTPEVLMANRDIFLKLSPADRELIAGAARDSVKPQWEASLAKEASSEVEVKKQGAKVIQLNETERQQFRQAAEGLYRTYGREYQRLIDRIRNTE